MGLGKVLAAAPVVGSRSGVAIVAVVAALTSAGTAHARGYGLDGQLWVEGEGTYMPNATGAPSFDASNVAVPGRTQPVSGSTGPFGSSMGFFGVRGGLDLVSQGRFIIPLIDIGFYGILGAYADTYTDAGGAPFRLHPAGSMMFDVELLGFGVRFKHRRWMFEAHREAGRRALRHARRGVRRARVDGHRPAHRRVADAPRVALALPPPRSGRSPVRERDAQHLPVGMGQRRLRVAAMGVRIVSAHVTAIGGGDPLRIVPSLLRELEQRYHVWDAFVQGERRVDLHPIVLSRALHDRAKHVAESVMRSVSLAASRAHEDPAERALYGLGASAQRLAEAAHFARDDASLVRVDLLLGEDDDFHACEINADCPGGHNEALGLPKLARAAGWSRGHDPTHVVQSTARRLASLAGKHAVGMIYATAYAEDLQVCAILRRELKRLGVETLLAPPTAPELGADGRLHIRGVPVGALYRYFPAEYMDGQENVSAIAQAIASGRVKTLSSFAHVYTQSKLSMARALAGGASVPGLPETYDLVDVPEEALRGARTEWVVKRSYSRVGEDVIVGPLCTEADWGLALTAVLDARRRGESWIAQRFVPQKPIQTPWGPRLLTLGVYLLDGVFVGVLRARHPRELRDARRPRAACVRRGGLMRRAVLRGIPFAVLSSACVTEPWTPSVPVAYWSQPVPDGHIASGNVHTADLMQRWALPDTDPWARFQKMTLLTSMDDMDAETKLPETNGLDVVQNARATARRVGAAGIPQDTLFIVDLRGPASVAFGAELSRASASPVSLVLTFNNWPSDDEIVPAEETLSSLVANAPRANGGGAPVFLLDAWRPRLPLRRGRTPDGWTTDTCSRICPAPRCSRSAASSTSSTSSRASTTRRWRRTTSTRRSSRGRPRACRSR